MDLTCYKKMLLIRTLETELQRLCDTGEVSADLHFSKGEEAIAVGACAALQPQDLLVVHHRMIGWSLSKGMPLDLLVAELLGKSSGVCGGKGGEMHMTALKYGLAHSFQLVGTCVPVAAGLAWAVKNYKKTNGIVMAVFGDAATSNAQWNEGMNIAAVQKVPLLLICENNGLAGNVPSPYYLPCSVVERARGFGITAHFVFGNHVEDVQEAVKHAAEWVRENSRPYLLDCHTTRIGKHKQGQGDMRSKEEIAALSKWDPLLYEEKRLGIDPAVKAQLLAEAEKEVHAAIDAARLAPWPAFGGSA